MNCFTIISMLDSAQNFLRVRLLIVINIVVVQILNFLLHLQRYNTHIGKQSVLGYNFVVLTPSILILTQIVESIQNRLFWE